MPAPKIVELGTVPQAIADIRSGRLPRLWPEAMVPARAFAFALELPRVHGSDIAPEGVGLMPPRNAEPQLRVAHELRTADGHRIQAGTVGMLGCLWHGRSDEEPMLRVWFYREDGSPLRFVDAYLSAFSGHRPADAVPGWEIVRLQVQDG